MLQKTKRILLMTVLAVICMLSLVLVACDLNVQPSDEAQYREVYGMYKAYAEEAGFTPLDYNDWLQSIKGEQGIQGEKGDKGDKGDTGAAGADGVSVVRVDSSVEKDENCVYRIVFTYHYSNGTITQSSVPYLLADGSTLTQHTYSSSWSYDDDYHWYAATCGHDSKDKAAHSWDNGVVTTEPTDLSDGVRTYTCAVCGKTKTERVGLPFGIPVTKKVTYVFKLADGNAAIPSYVSPYITGTTVTSNSFAIGTAALEFKAFGDTGWWYAESDVVPNPDVESSDPWNSYQLALGYNTTSGFSDAYCGFQWRDSLKSDECLEYAYPTNPAFKYVVGQKVINLGTHTFSTIPIEPIKITTTLVVKFAAALPADAKVAIVGDFNGWSSDNSWATIAKDRKSASLALTGVLCMPHEYKIKVFTEYKEGNFWNDENNVPYGVEFAGYEGKNLSVEIMSSDDGEELVLNNTFDKIGWALVLPTDGSHSVYIDKNTPFTVSAEPYKNLQKFGCWVDDDGNEVSTENPYTYSAKKEKQLTAVYKDFLTVENVVMDTEKTYSAKWDADTLTYSGASVFVGFGYVTEPLQYGMTIAFNVIYNNGVFFGFSTRDVLQNPSDHVWGTNFAGLFVPEYNIYCSNTEALHRLTESTGTKGGRTLIREEGFTKGAEYTIKVVFADRLQWYINGVLVVDDSYDTEKVYYCTLGFNGTICEFGLDKDTTMTSYSVPLTAEEFAGKKITFLGDSITAGTVLSDKNEKYSTVLASELNAVEYNMGVSGTTLCTGVSTRNSRLGDISKIPLDSDYVIIMLGTNDFDFARSNADYAPLGEDGSTDTSTVHGAAEQMCKQLAEMFADNKYHVFIVTPPARKDDLTSNTAGNNGYTLREFCEVLIAKAQKYGLQYIDMNIDAGLTADDMVDTVHPNVSGNAKMAAVLKEHLLANWAAYTPFVIQ